MLLCWIVFLPFASGLFLGMHYLYKPENKHVVFPVLASTVSMICLVFAVIISFSVLGGSGLVQHELGHWMDVGEYGFQALLQADVLSSILLLVVTGVGFLVHLFSLGYMRKDAQWVKYFSYLNLLSGSMALTLTAGSLPLLFVGWQGISICSFLLIGFWYQDQKNVFAGRKTFIVHRIGDAAFMVAMALILHTFGSLEFAVFSPLQTEGVNHVAYYPVLQLEIIAILLFIAGMTKSAQFPLHGWLPSVLKAPIPSIVMMYGATSIVAGIYLIARCAHVFTATSAANECMMAVGIFTALFGSILALFQNNIKKVVAYFAMSQLGIVITAMGFGAYAAGIFYLIMYAFFVSLLFFGVGSVMFGMNQEQDIKKMGGLKTKMVATTITFMFGYLAAIGFPFFSGYFGKGHILYVVSQSGRTWYGVLMLMVFVLTVIHMTRLLALTFLGSDTRVPLEQAQKIHESPSVMLWPLWILAACSVFAGWSFVSIYEVLAQVFPQAYHGQGKWSFTEVSVFLSVVVIVVCFASLRFYAKVKDREGAEIGLSKPMRKNLTFVDQTMMKLGNVFVSSVSTVFQGIEWMITTGIIESLKFVVMSISRGVCAMATGITQSYLFFILLGILFIIYFAVGM